MYKLALINMPFAGLGLPSLGLTQLQSLLSKDMSEEVSVKICYINQDFGRLLGVELYTWISLSGEAHNRGFGDWFFRQAAFPAEKDNTEEYFRRFFPKMDEKQQAMKPYLLALRTEIEKTLDSLIAKYKLDEAQIVGFTSMFNQNVPSFSLAGRLKEINPNIITVMGGANCESLMGKEIVKNLPYIDYTFSGPATKSFPQFVRSCMNEDFDSCNRINGVFSKENTGPARALPMLGASSCAGDMGEELDIDTYIELDYDEFLSTIESNFPNKEVQPIVTFETSRGCWWGEKAHCTFCGLNGQTMGYRAASSELAIKVIKSMIKYYPRTKHFNCVDNIMPKSYVREVLPFIEVPPDSFIFYEVKADLSEEDLQILSKAGVRVVQPGIESLATSTLKLMRKGTRSFQNILLLKNCVQYHITPTWNLLVGFPGEEEEVYRKYLKDLPLLVHLPPPDGAFPVRFDRFSPYFVKAKQYGLDLDPVDYYEMIYPLDKKALQNLAYYFTDRNLNAEYFLTTVKWIDKLREKVTYWRSRWESGDEKPRPRLFFKKNGERPIIYDSRSGAAVEHRLSDVSLELLKFMDKPKRLSDVVQEFGRVSHFDAQSEIGLLRKSGLIFEEGECYLNLVHQQEP